MGDFDSFYRMTPFEVAVGWVFGVDEMSAPVDIGDMDARKAFEQVVLEALRADGPTYVTFSGGRDSSAVLAVAVDQARKEGLDLPIPVTNRYPGVESAEEDEWQELVIRHLEVNDWVKLAYDEEDDLLGEPAQRSLKRFGLLWPPTAHLRTRLFETTSGGTILTGEGGDTVLGILRITYLTGLISRTVHPRRRAFTRVLQDLSPRSIRRIYVEDRLRSLPGRGWLRPDVRDRAFEMEVSEVLSEPLLWSRGVRRLPLRRAIARGQANLYALGRLHGVRLHHPFQDARFVEAWARQGGAFGYPGRNAAMRVLFEDLLPGEVVNRGDKTTFNTAYVRAPSLRFAESWTGAGLKSDLIDRDGLRREWLSDNPHAGSLPLLHAAWLGIQTEGIP